MDLIKLELNSSRRFGVEFEVNAFDNRDFHANPLNTKQGELPVGCDYIGSKISNKLNVPVQIMGYHHTHNNNTWIIKPDRSCGIEICSPVTKGKTGINSICDVAGLFSRDPKISADNRCSFHVHVDIGDCEKEQVAKILAYWIKVEPVFIDSFPTQRKRNKFCQCIGMTDLFQVNTPWDADLIIRRLGSNKYYSVNCEHYSKEKRKTIEFRLAESEACENPQFVKNWIRLILHFIECAIQAPKPPSFDSSNCWSGFSWFDLEDVFKLLSFTEDYELSPDLKETRDWFLCRICKNAVSSLPGIWSETARVITKEQSCRLLKEFNINSLDDYLYPKNLAN